MDWLNAPIIPPDKTYLEKALHRQQQLTKPVGSLGQLEEIAVRLAAMQHTEQPEIKQISISIFAADHGVAEESVSAFPQVVTIEMVKNFLRKGAAVNVLSRFHQASLEVIDVGLASPIDEPGLIIERAGHGTANFAKQAAMSKIQMQAALLSGKSAIKRALKNNAQLFIAGEMGIANTTSASAIAVALTGLSAKNLTGAGTGINSQTIIHKTTVIEKAIELHEKYLENPLKVLQYLGGFEIAAIVGAYLYAGQKGLPVLIDGFITSVAALLAVKINPEIETWFFYAHRSEEKGHQLVLEQLQAKPLLDLQMRLGEGSGALTAVPLLQMACKLHNEMATFEQANITTK